jgi:sugar-specific transcriptional regulator TrmB
MVDDVLTKIGLTQGEVKVYRALLSLGESTVGGLGKSSGVSKSKLYDVLDRLIGKGLVGSIVKDGVRHFSANDPKMILDYLSKKQLELAKTVKEAEAALPEFEKSRNLYSPKRIAEVFQGYRGIKAIREELLSSMKNGDELLVLGAPRVANEKWEHWFLAFHRKREAAGIKLRIIYDSNARDYGVKRTRFKLTKVKYLPSGLLSPNWIDVFNNAVLFVILLDEPIALVVRDKNLVESFRAYFDLMWKISLN